MSTKPSPGGDIGLAVMLIAVSLLTLYGTLELPPGSFEPLGSASIPQAVSLGIIVLSLWLIVRAWRQRGGDSRRAKLAYRPRHDFAAGIVVLSVVYVLVMAMEWASFSIATLAFLLLAVGGLSGFRRRTLPWVVGVAVVFGFGLEYVFTQVFVIDLP